jgi:molecular chaperone HscB
MVGAFCFAKASQNESTHTVTDRWLFFLFGIQHWTYDIPMPDHTHKQSAQTLPTKCAQCDAVIEGTAVCDDCKSLNPAATMMDHFSLLGLPRTYDLDPDELRRKYLALSRHAHPDYHVGESGEVQQLHMQVSAALNEAYRTLKDPASRASYLLERMGGPSLAEDKSVPEGFLETMMMMQEEVNEARQDGHEAELERLRGVLRDQRDGLIRRISDLFGQYQQALACQGVTRDLRDELRKKVNAVSYVTKLLAQAGG